MALLGITARECRMELRQGKHPTLAAFTVSRSTLSSFFPSTLFLSSSNQRTGLKVTNALTHACHRYSHWFFVSLPPSISLSLSLRSARLLVPTMCLCFFLLFEHEKSASSTRNRTPPVARSTSFVAWTLANKVHEARPLADHGYWFTMPRIIRHYPMWYMGSRGHRFSREPAACYVFPLSSTGSFLVRVSVYSMSYLHDWRDLSCVMIVYRTHR